MVSRTAAARRTVHAIKRRHCLNAFSPLKILVQQDQPNQRASKIDAGGMRSYKQEESGRQAMKVAMVCDMRAMMSANGLIGLLIASAGIARIKKNSYLLGPDCGLHIVLRQHALEWVITKPLERRTRQCRLLIQPRLAAPLTTVSP